MFPQLMAELEDLPPSFEAGELNMTRLLILPPGLRKLLTWMMRQKNLQVATVAAYIGEEEPATQELMDRLVGRGLLEVEPGKTGALYQVPIRSSRNYRVPDQVWKAFDE